MWPRGAMDNASAYGAEDCRFDPYRGRYFWLLFAQSILYFAVFYVGKGTKARPLQHLIDAKRERAASQPVSMAGLMLFPILSIVLLHHRLLK